MLEMAMARATMNVAGQLRESIRRVLDLSPRVFLSGHGGPFSAEDVKRVFLE